ncbi:hypothetical protein GHT06_009397 [Daphnia sinensis]|uniref:Uncharacterized protein n=1 Tax=Daphnia sinensis TaxID=1820382 RepID=A0AAD5Q3N0_9CRUS|nr:hypothetical protein GHT06_009397 [Daphnia sinensis]
MYVRLSIFLSLLVFACAAPAILFKNGDIPSKISASSALLLPPEFPLHEFAQPLGNGFEFSRLTGGNLDVKFNDRTESLKL